jgi:hypothetical protein
MAHLTPALFLAQPGQKLDYRFCMQWIAGNVLGFLISLYWLEVGERAALRGLEGAIGGTVIGLVQWLVLRRWCTQAGWWVLASTLGWTVLGVSKLGALGWVVPQTHSELLRLFYGLVDGMKMGAILGAGQWLVLRQCFTPARAWILVSILAWAIALGSGWVVGGWLRAFTGLFLGEVVGLALVWLLMALMTGVGLANLLQDAAIK